jgi:hypothetical protein
MRRILAVAVLFGGLGCAQPSWAVLTSVVITDQGHAIPSATISLSHPHPAGTHAAGPLPQQTAQQGYQQPAQPAYQQPVEPNWITARNDPTGRATLQIDDRQASPGSLVDITLRYPNGDTRQRFDVPIELLMAGGSIEITDTMQPQGSFYQPASPPPAYGYGAVPVPVPSIGIGIGVGGWGVGHGGGWSGGHDH